jgi:hypothetical protein
MTQLRQTVKTFRRRSTQNARDRQTRPSTALRTADAIASCENVRPFRRVKFVLGDSFRKKQTSTRRREQTAPDKTASPERVFSSRRSESPNKKRRRKQASAQRVEQKREDSFPRVFSPYTFVSDFPTATFTTFLTVSKNIPIIPFIHPTKIHTLPAKQRGLFTF